MGKCRQEEMNDSEIKITRVNNSYKCKITTQLFTDDELKGINTYTSELVDKFTKLYVKEKELKTAQILLINMQKRIDKAIEYIEDFKFNNIDFNIQELLDILKGSDKE